jgi:uncharacterized protein
VSSLVLRVTPRASRERIEGEYQGALKVRLTAPPLSDRAHQALCRLLARSLNVSLSAVRIIAGEKSRSKRVAVTGVAGAEIAALNMPRPPNAKAYPGRKNP